jgi:hypothetical protein
VNDTMQGALASNAALPAFSHMGIRLDDYRGHLAPFGMTREREDEVLASLLHMMSSFVDRAFGDDPVQHVHGMHSTDDVLPDVVIALDETHTDTEVRLSRAFASPAAGGRKKERS